MAQKRKTHSPARARKDAHAPYSGVSVRLVFGRNPTGKIVHVNDVERGAACNAKCPACDKPLIARQGEILAWHFAHADGAACAGAMLAGFAGFIAQKISEGSGVMLPARTLPWGRTERPLSAAQLHRFHKARVDHPLKDGGLLVLCENEEDNRALAIHLDLGQRRHPDRSAAGEAGLSVLSIDLRDLLREIEDPDTATLPEHALVARALIAAPRRWLFNQSIEVMRQRERDRVLGARIAALAGVRARTPLHDERACARLDEIGLSHLLEGDEIPGEVYLGFDARTWRARILTMSLPELRAGGMSRRALVRVIGRAGVNLPTELSRPLPEDDALELHQVVPDFRRPIEIVEAFFATLARRRYLTLDERRASEFAGLPATAFHRSQTLARFDWKLAAPLQTHVDRLVKAEHLLRRM